MTPEVKSARLSPFWPRGFTPVEEFDRLFTKLFDGDASAERVWAAPLSLWEDEQHFYIEMEAPGVVKDDLELTVEKGVLRIVAQRSAPAGERKYWHVERRFGRTERRVTLPDTADLDTIDAQLQHGVLYVTINKRAEAQPRRVTIKGE